MQTFPIIVTHYLSPTDYRGARIVATSASGERLTAAWDHATSATENHERAAAALADRVWDGNAECFGSGELPGRGGRRAHVVRFK